MKRINAPGSRISYSKFAREEDGKCGRIGLWCFLLRRRYLLMALALALAAVMFLAACLPELLL